MMIDIITTYSKPYSVILYSRGMSVDLEVGFTNKREANKCRTKWRKAFSRLDYKNKVSLLLWLRGAMKTHYLRKDQSCRTETKN